VLEVGAIYGQVLRELKSECYDEALKDLDTIDALATRPEDKAESLNLRGVVLTRECEYEGAEAALRRALEIKPKFWNASFNLAEIPFLRKDWAEARRRFEAMVADGNNEMENDPRQLIQYKILLTCVLDGEGQLADRMMKELERAKKSPAFYYARAAVARQGEKPKEAKDWIVLAEQQFPATLNKLYAESFYEIGWEEKPAGEAREGFEIISTAEAAARRQAAAQAKFAQAENAFLEGRTETALTCLQQVDESVPGQAPVYNLRGEILMEQKKLDEAQAVLREALAVNPKFREAEYNLAQVAFRKKQYQQSRDQLELLFGQTPGGGQNQAAQLIKFEVFLTFLLEKKESQAQQMMNQFKFTGETPALYYAQAAWAFQHANPDRGNDWVASARKIYSPALNVIFAEPFYDLGWLESRPRAITRTTEAPAETSAATSTGLSPEMSVSSPDWTPNALLSMNNWSKTKQTNMVTGASFSRTAPPILFALPNELENSGALPSIFDSH
jgi:tetratricopeptide (TPR) repeat protein